MRVLHLNTGNETGGGMHHILSLLSKFNENEVILGLFERGEMLERAKELGIPVVLFEQHNQKDLTVLWELIKFLREEDVQFVHTHGPRATFLMALSKRFIRQPVITTIHSNPQDDFSGRGLKGLICYHLYKWSFKNVDHFIVVSRSFSEIMQNAFNVHPNAISTIWNGIDFSEKVDGLNRFSLGFNDEDYIIIMIARLESVKRHWLAIEAFQQFLEVKPNGHLLLIGDGVEKDNVIKALSKNDLDNHVHIIGYQEEAVQYLEIADLFLLTSKSESFPLVLLEAARAKVPIVTTNVGDVKKLIPNDEYGTVVNEDSPKEIAQTMYQVATHNHEDQTEKLYEYAKSHFSLQHFL
ncbi:glycosyltransferase [Piscibacillus salipiscarius]|uniref:glycosyltransferase n=1 Tax=Piscibacillus salipiscarius TaxID=299480 RepID=UPI0006CF5596|nr:glycosyltransferase [Piscibacillus salipiscarius]